MFSYVLRRTFLSVLVLWGVLTLAFILTCLAPGDVAETLAGQRTDEATLESMRESLGLEGSALTRYFEYLWGVVRGDWGQSSRYREPVWGLIWERVPRTALLAGAALSFAIVVGGLAGVVCGIYRGTRLDRTLSFLSLSGISAPVFWTGLILMWLLSLKLDFLPPAGYEQGKLVYLVLPALTLGLRSVALIARISRAAIIEVGQSQFLRTAKAKGLGPWAIHGKHALRNAALPIVTVIGLDLGSYLSGSVLTEKVFGWPGLGRLTVDAILARDTALINACVAFMAIVFVLVNLLVDLLYGVFDPRVRNQG